MKYDEVVTLLGSVGGQAATTPKAGRLLYEFVRRSGAQRVLDWALPMVTQLVTWPPRWMRPVQDRI